MLSDEEKNEIQKEMEHYPIPQAACIDALRIVQKRHGWVSDEQLAAVAGELKMSPAELDSVATFYNLIYRRPVGRHVILICDSVSCWIVGYQKLLDALRARLGIGLGETTKDGRFTLLPMACLGACDGAPAMMIDDDLHTRIEPEQIDEILSRYE